MTPAGRASVSRVRVVREAAREELAGWDARTVDVPGGDVQQSVAWGVHRARTGWEAHHLVLDDGAAILALGRRWRVLGGGRLYVPRGPVAAGADPSVVAARLDGVAAWARDAGYDVVLADAEIPAATGYPALLAPIGFRPAEEVGPSRHRVDVAIAPGADDAALLAGISRATRQRFQAAERKGTRIVRYDRGGAPLAAVEAPDPDRLAAEAADAFARFHAELVAAGARRGFGIGSRATALAWWRAALDAGHLLLLEARARDDAYLGGAIFYRHGERLSYSHSADVVELRHVHTGTVHLLLWRALQLAALEGRSTLDLGGVDVRGARHEPRPGEPMYGLLEFKRSFGGRWIDLSGAHERILRRPRPALVAGARRVGGVVADARRAVRGTVGGRG
jgi:hypothetical protein